MIFLFHYFSNFRISQIKIIVSFSGQNIVPVLTNISGEKQKDEEQTFGADFLPKQASGYLFSLRKLMII
jgi:hypothetical protein